MPSLPRSLLPFQRRRIAWAAAGLLAVACSGRPAATPQRLEEVAARGGKVMPFDLSKTRHRFEKAPDGGLQTVTVIDAADTAQTGLIRQHLAHEAARFTAGDFSDPKAIHGADMPGLAALSKGAGQIWVTFTPLPEGGNIRYTTRDPALVQALHLWFDAQTTDHAEHAP